MALTEQDQRRIIEQEGSWVDPAFGGIDLSQFPSLQPPPPATSRDDGRFAKDWRDTALSASASALRKFVSDPDVSALERVGEETGNPDYLREVRDIKAETVAGVFKRKCPDYLPTEQNYERIVETLAFNGLSVAQQQGTIAEMTDALISAGLWTAGNLESAYKALTREGLLDIAAGQARNLSERERLRVQRLALTGQTEAAIEEFLHCSLPDEELTIDVISNPAYRNACDQAVMFVWECATADYTPTDERRAYVHRYAAGRPLTLNLLSAAWQDLKQREASYARHELLDQFQRPEDTPPPSAKEIDALDDDQVSRLYHGALKEYVNSFRRAPGVVA
jgi:hypothetical protein